MEGTKVSDPLSLSLTTRRWSSGLEMRTTSSRKETRAFMKEELLIIWEWWSKQGIHLMAQGYSEVPWTVDRSFPSFFGVVVSSSCFHWGKLYYTLQLTSFVHYSFVAVSLIVRHLELCFFLDALTRLRWTAIAFQDVAKPTKIYFSLSLSSASRVDRPKD